MVLLWIGNSSIPSALKSLSSLRKWKCFGEASFFKLHCLFFLYYLFNKNCSVYRGYCVNYTSKQFDFYFCHNFLRNVKKIECCSLGCLYYLRPAVHWWYPRPRAQFFPIQTSRPVNDILCLLNSVFAWYHAPPHSIIAAWSWLLLVWERKNKACVQ